MKLFLSDLKQKIDHQRNEKTLSLLPVMQSIHQQFDKRMHDLNYLQWMQRNSARYVAGLCVLTVLLSAAVLWRQNTVIDNTAPAYSYSPVADTAQNPAAETVQTAEQIDGEILHDEAAAEHTAQTGEEQHVIEKAVSYLNPLYLAGYQAPSSGMLQYNYGLGYDPVYEDYRFHHEICYAAGNGTVFACVNGVIADVQMNEQWQLAIETNQGMVWYRGLHTCDAAIGDVVTVGQQIGTAEDNLYIQVIKK